MTQSCCICHEIPCAGMSMHKIPKINRRLTKEEVNITKARRKAWIQVLERTQVLDFGNLEQYLVCSKHFVTGKPSDFRKQKDVDWIPSIECGEPKEVINTPDIGSKSIDAPTDHDRTEMTTADDNVECDWSNIRMDKFEKVGEDLCEFFNAMSSIRSQKGAEPEIEEAAGLSLDELQTALYGTKDSAIEKATTPQADDSVDEKAQMTALIESLQAKVISQDERIKSQNERINELEEAVERIFWTGTFELDDKKIFFYTGVQSVSLFTFILSRIEIPMNKFLSGISNLTNFRKLSLTLMKLRHNISYTGLSYHFNIRVNEASAIFKNVVVIIYEIFSLLVHWPKREYLLRNNPPCFKEAFGDKVAIATDCFEIKTKEPENGRAQAQMYSQCEAAQYLIGLSPHGFITFVSNSYVHAWDSYILNDCGILDNLVPGDIVLTECGSKVNEVFCPMRDAKLDDNMPASTSTGRAAHQCCPLVVIEAKTTEEKIAAVRIHVEREIRHVRNKYNILKGRVPLSFIREKYKDNAFLDIIVNVCCILTNLRDAAVNSEATNSK